MSTATPTPLVIYGTGGHGRETALLVQSMVDAGAPWQCAGFLDDDVRRHGSTIGDLPVLGGAEYLATRRGQLDVAVGIGSPRARRALVDRIRPFVRRFPVLVHPEISRFERVQLAEGAQVHAGAILTVDIAVGAFAVVHRHVDISHDCVVGAFASLAPASTLAGSVTIEDGAELGVRVACIPGVRVGAWSVVGAGAVVVRDIPDGMTAIGVPARPVALAY